MILASKLTSYLNQLLSIRDFEEAAINGLQVQGGKKVQKVAFAVDGVMDTFQAAADWGADYLIVHHGLFWGRPFALRGADYRRIKCLIQAEIALYAVHLPLDAHLELGHAARLLKHLGVQDPLEPFGRYKDTFIGAMGMVAEVKRDELLDKLQDLFPEIIKTLNFGREKIRRIACITGQGADFHYLKEAQIKNIDLYISGEATHPSFHYCREQQINLALCGHYQTETFGIKSLMEHLKTEFNLDVRFFDFPTGL
ncbi:MAG: Nif3-like dinuclear metal center hexameric protein [Acidobacteria bacterium]|nr:MAG: Nif3-like dinuclear metal center hexameric protein [Acidobacteriota bacterium]